MMTRIYIFMLLLTASVASAQVPNEFQAGQPARAAEVNENFAALDEAVQANADAIAANVEAIEAGDTAIQARLGAVVFDGEGNEIGQLISIGENGWDLVAISAQGYTMSIGFDDGSISSDALVYASNDCSGTPYALISYSGHVKRFYDASGVLGLYYVEKTALPIADFVSASISIDGSCFAQPGQATVWPVTVNDPLVTGVSTGTFPIPIRIDLP